MSLYLKYRPKDLSQIKGNKSLVDSLNNMLSNKETCPHTFLLHGPTGCGKTTIARIIANELGCHERDFIEINTADLRGIDTSREIINRSQFAPIQGSIMVWLIDECHKLTNDAQNALLKLLEDTPKHIYIILCTTDPQKLLSTIKGRCIQFQVSPLNDIEMFQLLRRIVRDEKEELNKQIFDQIIETSQGLPRNAIQILEQVLNTSEEERLTTAKKNIDNQTEIIELCRALLKNSNWNQVKEILARLKGQEAESIRRVVLGYCQAILLKSENDKAAMIIEEFWEPTYDIGFPGIVYACYSIINK
jgi:DNA polymerase-3 subunit gamma/tau